MLLHSLAHTKEEVRCLSQKEITGHVEKYRHQHQNTESRVLKTYLYPSMLVPRFAI